jgi:hypothetical protein
MRSLRAALCAGVIFTTAASGARGADGKDTKLVSAKFSAIQDQMGFRWDFAPNGQINDGTNDCFDGGPALHIGPAQFVSNRPMMVPGTGEYVLSKTKGNLKVTRRVLVDKKRGAVRYLEMFENTGTSRQDLTVSLNTRLGGSQTQFMTSAGKPFTGKLGRSDQGLMAVRGDQRPAVMFLVTGRGAKVRPTVVVSNGNRNVSFKYSLKIPPKKTVSLLHFVAQRNAVTPQAVPSVFKTFYRGRPIKGHVPAEAAGTIANFGRVSGSAGDEGGASVVADLADSLGVELGKRAALVMGEDAILTGDVHCAGLAVVTARGKVDVPFGEVAAVAGGAGSGRIARVYLRTGEVLVGGIEARGFEIETPRFRIPLDPERVNVLFTPTSKTDGKPPEGADAFVTTRSSERLAVKARGVVLAAATPWGTLRVPLEGVRSLTRRAEGTPLHSLTLTSGSRVSVILCGDTLAFETPRFGRAEVRPTEVASLARIMRSKTGLDFLPPDVRRRLNGVKVRAISADTKLSEALDDLAAKTTLRIRLDLGSDKKTAAALEDKVGIGIEGVPAFTALDRLAQRKELAVSWREGVVVLSPASDGDDDEEPKAPRLVLVGENVLVGEIGLPEISVATDAGTTRVRTADIVTMERVEEDGGFRVSFKFELVGGDRLTGAIEAPVLPVRVDLGGWERAGGARPLRVPVEHITSFKRPPPPGEKDEEGEEDEEDDKGDAEGGDAKKAEAPPPSKFGG